MQFSIDVKSVILGAFGGAAFIAAIGAVQLQRPDFGRFEIRTAGSDVGTSAFVLDTATGQVWQRSLRYDSSLETTPNFTAKKLGGAE